jgi:Mycoplasma protein of unknown function, DUF285
LQNSPLPIPITPSSSGATSRRGEGGEGERPGGPPLFQEGDEGGDSSRSSDSNGHNDHYNSTSLDFDDTPTLSSPSPPPPVEAVPITSIYQQVASAELVLDPRQQSAAASSPKPPSPSSSPTLPRPTNGNTNSNNSNSGGESEEAKLERMRLQRQRFKMCKLVLLLCILVVVITVPLVIGGQRLNASSTSASPSGGSATPPCFPSYEELESAVDDYLAGGSRKQKAIANWGSPIGIWCVSELPDGSGMDLLFSADRNPNAATFNEPLYYWDVSKIVSMVGMFQNATLFSQPLDGWNVGNVERMTGMFLGATNFRQNLCPWTTQLSDLTLVHNMFLDTSCDNTSDPVLQGSLTQSFCTPC